MLRLPARWAHFVLLLLCVCLLAASPGDERTALDEYVAKPDPVYGYTLVNSIKGDGVTTYVLEMTSQSWLTTDEVDRAGLEALDDRLQAGRGEDVEIAALHHGRRQRQQAARQAGRR